VRVLPQPKRVHRVLALVETYQVELLHHPDEGIWLVQPPVEPPWDTRHQPDEVEVASNPDGVEVGRNPDTVSAVQVEVEVVLAEAVLAEVVQEAVVVETMIMTMTTKAALFPHPDAWIKTVYNINCKFC